MLLHDVELQFIYICRSRTHYLRRGYFSLWHTKCKFIVDGDTILYTIQHLTERTEDGVSVSLGFINLHISYIRHYDLLHKYTCGAYYRECTDYICNLLSYSLDYKDVRDNLASLTEAVREKESKRQNDGIHAWHAWTDIERVPDEEVYLCLIQFSNGGHHNY